ncbi:MAG: hypothetical protein KDA25_03600, partial [Phycisphaerales bacterium]|nr:hypothetical protein [Phycisphaerales bacterium]
MTHVSPHHRRTSNRRRRLVTRTGAALVAAAIGLAVTTVTGAGPAPNETVTRTMSGTGTVTPTLRFARPRGTIVEPRLVERTAIRDVTGDGVPDWLAADDGAGEGDGAVGVRRTWLIDGASGRLRMACLTDALPLVPPDRARGDLDGDGVVDHRDVARAIERLAREPPPADAARALLDALSNLGRAPIADAIDDLDPPECDPDGACPCIPVQDPDGGWTCLCCLNCAGCEDRRPPGSSRPVGPPSGITPPPGAGGPGGPGGPDHGGGTGDDGADGPPPPRPGPAPPADTQPCLIVISDWSPDPDDACITVGDTVCYHVVAAAGGPTCPVLWTIDGPAAGSATPDGRTICITALGLGDIVVGATQDDCGCGGAAFVDVLPVRLGVDLDIDSDNSGDFALPDRSQAEDAVEDIEGDDAHPGKVILVNTLDADRDSIPDHLDGFGFPGAIEDALTSTGSRLHPVVIDLRGWPLDGEVELDILYDGPDRAAPILLAGPPYTMVDAPLRLWRADGAAARDPASIADGGDFIPPGRARAVDLGLSAAAPTTTIFVEALEPSVLVADRTIEVVAFIDGVEQCHDRVRLTAIRIELLGAAAPSGPYAPVAMLVASVPVDERAWSIPPPGTSWGIEPCFRVRIADPRGAPAGPVQLGAATLSLHAAPGGYETAPFCCLAAADAGAAGDLPLPVVLLDASDVVVSYNPATFLSVWAPKRPSEAKLGLGGLLIAVIRFLEESGWTPLDDADAGAFGKVVHEE